MVQHFINSIQMGDRTVIDRAKDAPADFIPELERQWRGFDARSRDIAILMLGRIDTHQSANFLLKATADPNGQTAAAAARTLEKQKDPPAGDSILNIIPSRENPFVRGKLYLTAGRAACGLDALRRTAEMEADEDAKMQALAAIVLRGGKQEKLEFFEKVRKARPDEVLAYSAHLLYINDPNLAKAMISWLGSTEGVMRIGYDSPRGTDKQARMCDFAIWNGKELGLATGAGAAITNYDPSLISRVRKLYSELPDPKGDAEAL